MRDFFDAAAAEHDVIDKKNFAQIFRRLMDDVLPFFLSKTPERFLAQAGAIVLDLGRADGGDRLGAHLVRSEKSWGTLTPGPSP